MFRKLNDGISVSPQITPDQVAEAQAQGATMIVNNRPDDEEPGQPSGAEIAAAAQAAGLDYRAIPVTHSGFSAVQLDQMQEALDAAGGPVLAYCRSGTRSTFLWALTRARTGEDPAKLSEMAMRAGYDLSPVVPLLQTLSQKG